MPVLRIAIISLTMLLEVAMAMPPTESCVGYFERPKLIKTEAIDKSFAGYTYHIEGELVPTLTIDMKSGQSIYFEHHILLSKHPSVVIGLRKLKGAFKRMIAGMNIFMTQATGIGHITFSRDGAGQLIALHMNAGDEIQVREHQFLAATDGVDYSFERVRGAANLLYGGTGFFIDRFFCRATEGILWLHGFGNVYEKILKPGEQLDVEPGAWLYKESSVRMETYFQNLSTGLFASSTLTMNRFTGPGKVVLQSMYWHMPTGE